MIRSALAQVLALVLGAVGTLLGIGPSIPPAVVVHAPPGGPGLAALLVVVTDVGVDPQHYDRLASAAQVAAAPTLRLAVAVSSSAAVATGAAGAAGYSGATVVAGDGAGAAQVLADDAAAVATIGADLPEAAFDGYSGDVLRIAGEIDVRTRVGRMAQSSWSPVVIELGADARGLRLGPTGAALGDLAQAAIGGVTADLDALVADQPLVVAYADANALETGEVCAAAQHHTADLAPADAARLTVTNRVDADLLAPTPDGAAENDFGGFIYDKAELHDDGMTARIVTNSHTTATEIMCKTKSRSAVAQAVYGNFAEVDATPPTCAGYTEATLDWVQGRVSPQAWARFAGLEIQPDAMKAAGPEWVFSPLVLRPGGSGRPGAWAVQSPALVTQLNDTQLDPEFAGNHYCKVLSPVRTLDLVLSDAIDPTYDPQPPTGSFTAEVVDPNLLGASFAVDADVDGDGATNPVVSSFGNLAGSPAGGGVAPVGSVAWYERGVGGWTRHEIATTADGISFPNEVAMADLDGDTDLDAVVPGGFFICALYAANCGSLSWFEQTAIGWTRHVLVEDGSPVFFHKAIPVDFDGDGLLDLVTVGETTATAQAQVFKGTAVGQFATTPTELGVFGGSLPVVEDVDSDGDLDIASAQFFLPNASFAWLERVNNDVFVPHTMSAGEGGSIMLAKVPGVGWVGTNHTNTTSVPAQPREGVYVLKPGLDPRLAWSSELISEGIRSRPHERGVQGAPGVFGWGDVDGDGDTDLAVSGDGDPRVFWLRNNGTAGWSTEIVASSMGQAGGGRVANFDGSPGNEILFSSYDAKRVVLYRLP